MWLLGEEFGDRNVINVIVVCIWWRLFSLVLLLVRFLFPRPKKGLEAAWAVAGLVCPVLQQPDFPMICLLLWSSLKCRSLKQWETKGEEDGKLECQLGWPFFSAFRLLATCWVDMWFFCPNQDTFESVLCNYAKSRCKLQLLWENLDVWSPLPFGNWAHQLSRSLDFLRGTRNLDFYMNSPDLKWFIF